LASENSVRFSGLTLAGPYGFGFAKNPNPIGPDPKGSAFLSQNPTLPDPFRSLGEAFLVEELFDCFVDELHPCVGINAGALIVWKGRVIVVGFK
jgi:hypothetical protein